VGSVFHPTKNSTTISTLEIDTGMFSTLEIDTGMFNFDQTQDVFRIPYYCV
jgi:hypothetical protein